VDRRKRWWNGRFANPFRKDVYLWQEQGWWHVQASRGGIERRSRLFAFPDESAALSLVETLMASDGKRWREVGI
jgi:hypothetical protein